MDDKVAESVNSVVAEALKNVGVAPRDINLPPAPEPGSEPDTQGKAKLDGSLKGQTKGEALEDQEEETPPEDTKPSKTEPGETEGEPLAKADIVALIDQAGSKFQSIMDRKINQLNAQMQQTVNALNQFFQTQDSASLAGLPPEEQVLRRLESLEKGGQQPKIQIQQPIEQQPVQFVQYLTNLVDAVGLKIDDKRIDWAPDENNPQTGFNRFTASIKKALVEDQTKTIQDLKSNGDKELQKVRKKIGVDKVSTTGAGGAGLPNLDKMTPFQKLEYGFEEAKVANQT